MNCEQIESEGVIEQYLAGRLPNAARKAFERHYFGCDRCFEDLEAYRAAGVALKGMKVEQTRRSKPRWAWPVAIAAAILLTFAGVLAFRHAPVAPPKIAQAPYVDFALLTNVEPPRYSPSTLRGLSDPAEAQFQSAMEPYRKGNYAAAAETLRHFVAGPSGGKRVEAEFFLGACYLLTDRVEEASGAFEKVLAEESPFREEAHFLMGKTWLKKGNGPQARAEFEAAAAMNGETKAAAQKLLRQLKAR